ncbi:MAG: NUDIX hydrolase [Bacteroidales bacterium]|nr:NUDIX hydrolase [Bacteroidales bacterium]
MDGKTYCYRYPHPSVTTDCVVFGLEAGAVKVLLIERGAAPYKGCWAFPGGFLNIDEAAEDGVRRELMEETGLAVVDVRQFHTFSAPDRDPRERVISIAFYAVVDVCEVRGGDDAAHAAWFALDEVPPLAFDHREMLDRALAALRERYGVAPTDGVRFASAYASSH